MSSLALSLTLGLSPALHPDALQKYSWHASMKSPTALPDVLSRMNGGLASTQKLGDAFLGQQKELFDAVQALRHKAQAAGHLKRNERQTVKTAAQPSPQVIVTATS